MYSLTKCSSTLMILEFSNATQHVCLCLGLSVIFIILFMMTPLNNFLLFSIFGKVAILTLLGYTLYYNTQQTNKFVKNIHKFTNVNIWNKTTNWEPLHTNVLCSYIFSVFLIVLILSVIHKIFKNSF
jgi:hypothetical protein